MVCALGYLLSGDIAPQDQAKLCAFTLAAVFQANLGGQLHNFWETEKVQPQTMFLHHEQVKLVADHFASHAFLGKSYEVAHLTPDK